MRVSAQSRNGIVDEISSRLADRWVMEMDADCLGCRLPRKGDARDAGLGDPLPRNPSFFLLLAPDILDLP